MAHSKMRKALIISWIYIIISVQLLEVQGHARFREPPSRASMWRDGFKTPPDYNDSESFCGGKTRQHQVNGGKCGICGDPWDLPHPRPHEAGGKFSQGIIVRNYTKGSSITMKVEVTANHKGFFEFRLCPNTSPKKEVTQECLDKYLLKRAKPAVEKPGDKFHETKFYPGNENKVYEMRYLLPKGLTCSHCVLQWTYVAGNDFGRCPNGTQAIGCGPQEEYRSCADISITDHAGGV